MKTVLELTDLSVLQVLGKFRKQYKYINQETVWTLQQTNEFHDTQAQGVTTGNKLSRVSRLN